jgi:hypothetical protein
MENLTELEAFDALAKHPRLADLVALVRGLATDAASARSRDWKAPEKRKTLAEEHKLDAKEATTELGDLLQVLEAGPKSQNERSLLRALWGHAVAESRPKTTEDEDKLASTALWLAAHTPFDATMLFDRALGDEAEELWVAIGDLIQQVDRGEGEAGRAEALVGAAALAASSAPSATKVAERLVGELRDPALVRILRRDVPPVAKESPPDPVELAGEIRLAPRGAIVTAALALSGILLVMHAVRLSARAALGYKNPARVTISETGARVRWRTEILGRTIRERDVVLGREGLASVLREVRYPRAAFYAGLFFLAVGSFVGVRTLADGVRAASPSLLLTGLVFVALGILLDFGLGSLVPGVVGRCRLIFVPRAGAPLCVAEVSSKDVDLALTRLAKS